MVAAEFNNEKVVEYLLEETEIALEGRNVDGETALCIAIHRGHVELVRMLCEVRVWGVSGRPIPTTCNLPPATSYHSPPVAQSPTTQHPKVSLTTTPPCHHIPTP